MCAVGERLSIAKLSACCSLSVGKGGKGPVAPDWLSGADSTCILSISSSTGLTVFTGKPTSEGEMFRNEVNTHSLPIFKNLQKTNTSNLPSNFAFLTWFGSEQSWSLFLLVIPLKRLRPWMWVRSVPLWPNPFTCSSRFSALERSRAQLWKPCARARSAAVNPFVFLNLHSEERWSVRPSTVMNNNV